MQIRNEGSGWIDIMVVSNVNFKWVIFCVPFRITHPSQTRAMAQIVSFERAYLKSYEVRWRWQAE